MSYETILYEKVGHKGVVTLNRPEVMNAFSAKMQEELVDLYLSVKRDRDVWVLIITGAGERAFCSGADPRGGRGDLPGVVADGHVHARPVVEGLEDQRCLEPAGVGHVERAVGQHRHPLALEVVLRPHLVHRESRGLRA